jgi:hypothetical protein
MRQNTRLQHYFRISWLTLHSKQTTFRKWILCRPRVICKLKYVTSVEWRLAGIKPVLRYTNQPLNAFICFPGYFTLQSVRTRPTFCRCTQPLWSKNEGSSYLRNGRHFLPHNMATTQCCHLDTHHRRNVKYHHDEQTTKVKYNRQIWVYSNTKDVKFHVPTDVCYVPKSCYVRASQINKLHV